jgi:phospholipid/cholesterol/gamma-HCH transport system ATP-binding protein
MKSNRQAEPDNPPVVVKGLRKSFGKQRVLNGIDLTVAKGETVAVLGRSGTGKSVLLKLLVGLQSPDAGSISIQGEEITGLEINRLNEIRKKMGFLFQQGALYDSLTVEQNVAFPLSRHSKLSASEIKDRVRELLTSVGMQEGMQKLPSEISGGMQKRVGLARALALDPDILLFDEPTAGLDPITSREIDELILKLQRERKISSIVVTHYIPGAKAISDRMLFMQDGAVIAEGKFEDLQNSQESFVSEFLKECSRSALRR